MDTLFLTLLLKVISSSNKMCAFFIERRYISIPLSLLSPFLGRSMYTGVSLTVKVIQKKLNLL